MLQPAVHHAMREVVLPSGRFAAVRDITWEDRVCTFDANTEFWIFKLAGRVVKIDGENLTLVEAAQMTMTESNPIIEMIAAELILGIRSRGVV